MNLLFNIKLYVITFLVFFGIDFVWLTKVAPEFYRKNIGHLLADKPNLIPAGIFYIVNIIGLLVFVLNPALSVNSPKKALILGALYGFLTYATYDLTNHATLKGWPLKVTITDIVWGTFLTAAVSIISYFIATNIK